MVSVTGINLVLTVHKMKFYTTGLLIQSNANNTRTLIIYVYQLYLILVNFELVN